MTDPLPRARLAVPAPSPHGGTGRLQAALARAATGVMQGLIATALLTGAAQASEVEVYAQCLLDGVRHEFGERQDNFDSPVMRRDGEDWKDLIVMRNGWLHTGPDMTAYWQDNDRTTVVAYRADRLGDTQGAFGWVAVEWNDAIAAGHGDAACTVLREHRSSGIFLPGEPLDRAGDTVISRCTLAALKIDFSTDADADYQPYWQSGNEVGSAHSLVNYVARNDLRRAFAYDDGFAARLVAHTTTGQAVTAFVINTAATIGSGQGTGTCEVRE
jgi:hypothetical protein